jgi:hypothetical protein
MATPLAAPAPARHPLDPEPVRSTKATAVLVLGVIALVTGPLVGGMVPAVVGLTLARAARADLVAGRGYLTGAERLRRGEILALVGLGLAALTLVVAAVAAMLSMAADTTHDFPGSVD